MTAVFSLGPPIPSIPCQVLLFCGDIDSVFNRSARLLSVDDSMDGFGHDTGDFDDEAFSDGGDDDDDEDDDDFSWKVRRASAKTIEALILTHNEHLTVFYATIAPTLIQRLGGTYTDPSFLHSSNDFPTFCWILIRSHSDILRAGGRRSEF